MEIIKKHLTNGQYLTHQYEKKSIFLHHTVGQNAEGAWQWWNQTPERVGTPYIIDRDGKIIECFDPSMWAFHLGIPNDDNYQEMHSVNIELVSCGRLWLEQGKYWFYPLYPNKNYKVEIHKDEVEILDEPWRGWKAFHKYSDAQIEALKELIPHIIGKFPSIKAQMDLEGFWEYNSDVVDKHLSGIFSHSTVRKDKDDIFPYEPLISALKEIFALPKPKTTTKLPKSQLKP